MAAGRESVEGPCSPPPGRDTWLGYHRDMRRLPRLRALIDHLIAAG